MSMEVDHLVIAASTLEEGRLWCEQVLGVSPQPGGQHAWMGTHNLLLNISAPNYPRCYLEIIAIDPSAPKPARARWFDLDQPAVQAKLKEGPGLLHWVARVPNLEAALAYWQGEGVDAGQPVEGSRGDMRWRLALREDGRRLRKEGLPTPIEWSGTGHPTDKLPDSGVQLQTFEARDGLSATLSTPKGEVALSAIEATLD
ncbi:VOC family protein [Roseateles sp. SL47]|jgi:Glyoxalase-like domain|uniref:VOC family protein n=1 Tax=Roseateles sp. SL47 TaxID=2995138 RepID=UPI00227080AF|nr:VOC family protein [Roseateles sp. SL47]WAC73784.1 VOC family protein [Roseateles sp. SL47]